MKPITRLAALSFVALTGALLSACAGSMPAPQPMGLPAQQLSLNGTPLKMANGNAEMAYAAKTGQLGMLALETSRVAAARTGNPAVRAFAESEIEEQTTVAQVLMKLSPNMPKPALTQDQAAMVTKLSTLSGDALVREYINGQVMGHQMLLAAQDEYIRTDAMTPQMIAARLARGRIMDHLQLLKAFRSGALR